jgi:hypothetical protein
MDSSGRFADRIEMTAVQPNQLPQRQPCLALARSLKAGGTSLAEGAEIRAALARIRACVAHSAVRSVAQGCKRSRMVAGTGFEPATPTPRTGSAGLRLPVAARCRHCRRWPAQLGTLAVASRQCSARSPRVAQASERHRLRTRGGLLTTSLTQERERVVRRESVGRGCAPWLSRTPLQAAPRFP